MAWCPFAEHKPLPEQGKQRATEEKRLLIYHSAAGASKTLYPFFRDSTSLESHFFISYPDGRLEQYLSTDQRADANREANDEAISVETGDIGDPDRQIWTPPMMDMGVRLGKWCTDVHPKIGRVRATAPNGHGIGYHTMWGAPSPWTPVAKTCPGRVRIAQFPELLRRIQLANDGEFTMDAEARERLDRMERQLTALSDVIIGADKPELGTQNPRHNSVVTRLGYLFGESLAGDNLGEFRALLDNAVRNAESIEELKELMGKLEEDLRAPTPPGG